MKKLSANVCAVTHAGRVRKENEDNYSLNGRLTSDGSLKKGSAYVQKMTEPFHLAVCDGMGGESYGEVASAIAIETIARNANNVIESGADFTFAVYNCLDEANKRICREITERGTRMGTTLAAVYAVKGKVICAAMGDTRIYHFSNGILQQASFDHTHAQGIVDAGVVSQQDIDSIPNAKRLTKHLGVFPEEAPLQPNISLIDNVEDNDVILLCSDGLTDMLTDEEISAVISAGETPQDVSAKLIRKALENGGKDNVTVVTAFISAEDTSVFVPIAEAMVGDKDPDYEEEYRSSFSSSPDYNDVPVSPYLNADARAYEKPVDKRKILMIAGIIAAVVAVIVIGIVIISAVLGDRKSDTTETKASTTHAGVTVPSATTDSYLNITTIAESDSSTGENSTLPEMTSSSETKQGDTTTSPRENPNNGYMYTTASTSATTSKTTQKVTDKTTEKTTEKTTGGVVTEAPATEPSTEPSTEPTAEPSTEAPSVSDDTYTADR